MKTSDLIDMLSATVEPIHGRVWRTIVIALAAGAVVATGAMLAVLGIRPDLWDTGRLVSVGAKIAFALGIVALASIYLNWFAHPGGERRAPVTLTMLPFVAILALAAISVLSTPSRHWQTMLLGNDWPECLLSIPLIAIVPFALLVWAMRQMAPTDLRRAGALTGLAAGGVSAAAYALHCNDDSLPFVALWYGGTIALCTVAGALFGPRLLRW